jgi:hypothetical protein
MPRASHISDKLFDFWLLLPVRVQVQCPNKKKSHLSSAAGKSQMNPLNYLHLPRSEVDIRGSQIAMYFLFNPDDKVCSTIVFNFQDGRWSRVVEEPILRVKEALQESCKNGSGRDPFYVQAVFLTSALRWWNNALNSFNDQLIAYVCKRTRTSCTTQTKSLHRKKSFSSRRNRPAKPKPVSALRLIELCTAWQLTSTVTAQSCRCW